MNSKVNPVIGSVVSVINEYTKTLEDEIDLKVDDRIQIILDDEEYNDGWYYGKNLRTNLIGLFPKCFTIPVEQEKYGANEEHDLHGDQGTITSDTLDSILDTSGLSAPNSSQQAKQKDDVKGRQSSFENNTYLTRNTNVSGSRRVLSPLAANSSQTSLLTPKKNEVYSSTSGSLTRNYSRVVSNTSLNSPIFLQNAHDEQLLKDLMKESDVNDIAQAKNVTSWEPKDVAIYFHTKHIDSDSCLKFYDHKIDGKILLDLGLQDLKNELDIMSFGTRYNINKEIENLKQLVAGNAKMGSDYDSSSLSPSVRSSRRSSLLLPAATVRNIPLPQSANESVTLNNSSLATGRKISSGLTGELSGQLTRNGTQSYRTTSQNKNIIQVAPSTSKASLSGVESSIGNIKKTESAAPTKDLDFESPRRAPLPPNGPSPVTDSLPKSPMGGNFYHSQTQNANNGGERLYSGNNNSASNMLKRSTSFLQRNLSFKGVPSNSNSRNVTPSHNGFSTNMAPPGLPRSNSSFNNNILKTPLRGTFKESMLDAEINVTPTMKNHEHNEPSFGDQKMTENKQSGFETLDGPIYQPPKDARQILGESRKTSNSSVTRLNLAHSHRRSESGGSFLDLFNRLDSIHLGSGKNSPAVGQNPQFITPTSHTFGNRNKDNFTIPDSFDDKASSGYFSAERERPTSSIYVHSRTNTNTTNYVNAFGHSKHASYISDDFKGDVTQSSYGSVLNETKNDESGLQQDDFVDFDRTKSSENLSSAVLEKINNANKAISKPQLTKSNTLSDIKKITGASKNSYANEKSGTSSSSSSSKLKKFQTSAFKEGINLIPCKESAKTSTIHGWMSKKNSNGGIKGINTWKRRYFLLHGTRLSYYTSPEDDKERGLIDITGYSVVPCNMSSDNNTDRLITLFSSSVSTKNKYFFKIIPPKPGSKKGVNFTQQKVYYFALETQEETRAWMNNMLKATIDLDTSVPIISSCDTPTISLEQAKELLEEARNELLEREKIKKQHLSNNTILIQSPQKQLVDDDEENFNIDEYSADSNDQKEVSLDPFRK